MYHRSCYNCVVCHKTLDSIIHCDGPDKEIYCKGIESVTRVSHAYFIFARVVAFVCETLFSGGKAQIYLYIGSWNPALRKSTSHRMNTSLIYL